jgi:hypothetical protein
MRHVRHRLHRGECGAVVAQWREAQRGRRMVDATMSDDEARSLIRTTFD